MVDGCGCQLVQGGERLGRVAAAAIAPVLLRNTRWRPVGARRRGWQCSRGPRDPRVRVAGDAAKGWQTGQCKPHPIYVGRRAVVGYDSSEGVNLQRETTQGRTGCVSQSYLGRGRSCPRPVVMSGARRSTLLLAVVMVAFAGTKSWAVSEVAVRGRPMMGWRSSGVDRATALPGEAPVHQAQYRGECTWFVSQCRSDDPWPTPTARAVRSTGSGTSRPARSRASPSTGRTRTPAPRNRER